MSWMSRRWWAVGFSVATALTLLFPTQNYMALRAMRIIADRAGSPAPPPVSWLTLLAGELPVWYSWLLISPIVVLLARRFPIIGPRWWRSVPVHVAAGLAFTVVVIMITTAIRLLYGMDSGLSYIDTVAVDFLRYFGYFLVIYAAIVAIFHAVEYHWALRGRELHASRLEARLAHSQLDVLKMQLQPHFLFNTLNSIAALMFKDVGAAHRTIVLLADLLRLSLENAAEHEVPLRDELAFLDRYLEIQRIRFRDRLQVDYRVDPDAERLLVPRLLLQPLVENSIRHGVERQVGVGEIVVRCAVDGDRLTIEIRDNGPGVRADRARNGPARGIGIRNTRLRLATLYGDDYEMSIDSVEPTGAIVRIEIPRRTTAAVPVEEAAV